jgi:hypothetical protein
MGPTKVIVKGDALHDAQTGKLIHNGFATQAARQEYAKHHYIVLPEVDNAGHQWELDGQPVYCLRGTRYETLDEQQRHLARCPDCGGMCIRTDEVSIERDCIRCVRCGHEFDSRLEMMES